MLTEINKVIFNTCSYLYHAGVLLAASTCLEFLTKHKNQSFPIASDRPDMSGKTEVGLDVFVHYCVNVQLI